jgi:phosphatidylinositol-3,4,5-trisphosphate 3-phosphatase and dual-specificity protein phosphatase PTEN
MGWLWIVPLFHLKQPSSQKAEKTTIHFKRSDVDFPLGYGALLVDVELTLGWDLDTLDEELPREPERSLSGHKKEPSVSGVLAALEGNVEALQATRD